MELVIKGLRGMEPVRAVERRSARGQDLEAEPDMAVLEKMPVALAAMRTD